MLAGIGGKTVAEAQQRISYPEFIGWLKYRRQHGGLNVAERVERSIAVFSAMFANMHRLKGSAALEFTDFTPHHQAKPVTLEEAMKEWS